MHMGQDAGGLREVAGGGLEAVGCGARAAIGELGEEGGEVPEDVEELKLEVITRDGAL